MTDPRVSDEATGLPPLEQQEGSSMATDPPPMFGERPLMDLTCGRWFGDTNCGKPATWHFMWTEDGENGLCCDEHQAEALRRWSHHDKHPITAVCTMPDSSWFYSWDQPPGMCAWTVTEDTMALQEAAMVDA